MVTFSNNEISDLWRIVSEDRHIHYASHVTVTCIIIQNTVHVIMKISEYLYYGCFSEKNKGMMPPMENGIIYWNIYLMASIVIGWFTLFIRAWCNLYSILHAYTLVKKYNSGKLPINAYVLYSIKRSNLSCFESFINLNWFSTWFPGESSALLTLIITKDMRGE